MTDLVRWHSPRIGTAKLQSAYLALIEWHILGNAKNLHVHIWNLHYIK